MRPGHAFRLPGLPTDLTSDDASSRHPHGLFILLAIPSQTAGSTVDASNSTPSMPSALSRTAPLAPPPTVQKLVAAGQWSLPTHARLDPLRSRSRSIHSPSPANGSSRPLYLFKKTSVHDRWLPPPTSPFPGPQVKPLLEVLFAAANGSSKPFYLFKRTSVQNQGLPLQSRPFLASEPMPVASLAPPWNGSSKAATTDPESGDRDLGGIPAAQPTHERSFRLSSRSRSR